MTYKIPIWIAVSLVAVGAHAQNLTNQLHQLGGWDVSYPIGAAIFHTPGSSLIAALPDQKKVVHLNLSDGTVTGGYDFSREAGALTISPDQRRLYAALPLDPGGLDPTGRVAVIDLDLNLKLRELEVDLRPDDLVATDSGILIACGSPSFDGGFNVGTFDSQSGSRIGNAGTGFASGLALLPGQTNVYAGEYEYIRRFDLNPLTGDIAFSGMSPQQAYPVGIENRIYAHPNSIHIVSRGGRISEGLNSGVVLQTNYRFEAAAFDLARHAFFLVAVSRSNAAEAWLMQYHSESLELGTLYPIEPTTRYLHILDGEILLVAVRTNGTSLTRFEHPTLAGETNQNPQADFRWTPESPGTFAKIQFDASLSTDEDAGTLAYRWDWNNDGRYDTDWARTPKAEYTFNIVGSKAVVLQVKDRYGATHRVVKQFMVDQASDYGVPAEPNTAYELPFAAADVAFDPNTLTAYLADTNRNRLVRINLLTGLAERDFWLQTSPQSLAITPGGSSMYVGLVVRPRPANTSTSFVAQVDLQLGARTREFGLDMEPGLLIPTDLDILVASDGRATRTYRMPSGQRLWNGFATELPRLSLHPAQTNLYEAGYFDYPRHYGLNTNSGALSSLWTSTRIQDTGGKLYPNPAGTNLLTRSGYVCTSSTIRSNDLVPLARFFTGAVERVAFDLPRKSIFAIASPLTTFKTNLYYFNLDSLELVSTYVISNGTRYVMAYPEHIYAVAIRTNHTFIYRFPHPAAGAETNQAPTASFTFSPDAPTTLNLMRFDAGSSTDDQDTAEKLAYRWDWDGDGTFDSPYTNAPIIEHHFNVAGTKTVVLEVKDHFGATARATNTFEVLLVEDPGHSPDPLNAPFELPFVVGDMVFETGRPYAYAADTVGRRLAKVNLNNGLIERYFNFDYYPTFLSLSAAETNLYIATLLVPSQWINPKPKSGFIACFDLTQGVKLREFKVSVNPYSIAAVGSNHLAICTAYSGGYGIYDVGSGQLLDFKPPYLYGAVAAEPSQGAILYASYGVSANAVGLLTVDPATGTLSGHANTGDQGSTAASGRIFPLPGASLAVGRGAGVFQYSLSPSNRIAWVRNLLPISVESLSQDPTRSAFFTVGDARDGLSALAYYNSTSLEAAAVYPDTNRLRFVHATTDTLFLVATESERSVILRRPNPAAGSETNQAPTAAFQWSPYEPRAGEVVRFDASSSHDEPDTVEQLRYRWDWTDDGIFDTEFTNSPFLELALTNAGTAAITLEVLDRFGVPSRIRRVLAIQPGAASDATFALQFTAGAAVFDPRRPVLYATDRPDRRLVWLNLDTAQVEHEMTFDKWPGALALHPVDDVLYLALTSPPSDSSPGGTSIVGIDLQTRTIRSQFNIDFEPYELAVTTNGFLVAVPADGQWVSTKVYRLSTGQETGSAFLRHRSHVVIHPAGTAAYFADTDMNPPGLVKCSIDPVTGALALPVGGPSANYNLFMHPEGKYLLLGNSLVVTALGGTQPDMEITRQLTNANFTAATFDLDHHALLAAGYAWGDWNTGRLYQFEADTLEPVAAFFCDLDTRYLHTTPNFMYGVAPKPDWTLIRRQTNPAKLVRFESTVRNSSGQLEATVRSTPGNTVVISSSENLRDWQPLTTNTMDGATWTFRALIGNEPARYYRAEARIP